MCLNKWLIFSEFWATWNLYYALFIDRNCNSSLSHFMAADLIFLLDIVTLVLLILPWKPQWFHINPATLLMDYSIHIIGHFYSHNQKGVTGFLMRLVNLQEIKIKLCMFMTYRLKQLKKFYGPCSQMFLVSTCPSIKRGRN